MFDGTWQKRGFSPLICAESCISATSGKVIDIEDLTKTCKGCQALDKLQIDSEKRERLEAEHNCIKREKKLKICVLYLRWRFKDIREYSQITPI